MNCAMNDSISYIKLAAQIMAGVDPDTAALAFLIDLQLPMDMHGFEYLKAAVLLQSRHPTMDLQNDIYPAVGRTYGNLPGDVIAAAVRRIVRSAWKQGNYEKWLLYLPAAKMSENRPPTNGDVIAGLARSLELWEGCANAYLRQQHKEVVSYGRK